MIRIPQSRDEHIIIGATVLSEAESCLKAHQEPQIKKKLFLLGPYLSIDGHRKHPWRFQQQWNLGEVLGSESIGFDVRWSGAAGLEIENNRRHFDRGRG